MLKLIEVSRRSILKVGLGAAVTVFGQARRLLLAEETETASKPGRDQAGQAATVAPGKKDPLDYVNGLFGTASLDDPELIGNAPPPGEELYTGMVCPGAALPHGVDISPVNKDVSLAYPHGNLYSYTYPRHTMVGFSSMVDDMLIMPLVGDWTTPPDRIRNASAYDHSTENSSPGHYAVYLRDHEVHVDLTVTRLTGLYQFTFPKTDRAVILLDLGPEKESKLQIVDSQRIQGRIHDGTVFILEFSKPFNSFGTFHREPPTAGMVGSNWFLLGMDRVTSGSQSDTGTYTGCYVSYKTEESEAVLVRIAAANDLDQAQKTLREENRSWNFAEIKSEARQTWKPYVESIEVKGGSEKQRSIFYSCLYHAFASPVLVAEKGNNFRGLDGKTYRAEHDRYDLVPYWDTGRNQVVLMTLLEPEVKLNVLRSQVEMAEESRWMGTSFHGDHAVAMFLGDWERGVKFDYEKAYESLYRNATDPKGPREKLAEYLEKGWIHDEIVDHPSPPYEGGNAGVSKTLEYCYDDHCLAVYAQKLGKQSDSLMFLKRAATYRNVWDPSSGFMRGRREDGSWIAPFYPTEPYYNFMYKESTAWQTTWFVPHDIQGLIQLMGGRKSFLKRLDDFFSLPYRPKGIARDITGLIGQYCHGNEPDHHAPYLYNWAGAPWKTQELVRKILKLMYGSDRAGLGLAGMDDRGENCSWFVLSALGFYTVNPARAEYIIGSPLFDEAKIHLGNGKTFAVIAENNSEKNIYIQSATLNGKALNQAWFLHSELENGGELIFKMGASPNTNWGSAPESAPFSMSR
jgi:predicted alpha-1,2-mannosidase